MGCLPLLGQAGNSYEVLSSSLAFTASQGIELCEIHWLMQISLRSLELGLGFFFCWLTGSEISVSRYDTSV